MFSFSNQVAAMENSPIEVLMVRMVTWERSGDTSELFQEDQYDNI